MKLVYILFISLITVLSCIPLRIRSASGYILGYIVGFLPLRENKIIQLHFNHFFPRFNGNAAPKVMGNFVSFLFESINLSPILKKTDSLLLHNADLVDSIALQNRGIVVLTAHYSNWELLAQYFAHKGLPLVIISRVIRSPLLQKFVSNHRKNIETLWRGSHSEIKKIHRYLAEDKKIIAALVDQDTEVRSVFVPFFDIPASTPSSLVTIAQKTNARIFTAFIRKDKKRGYEIFLDEIDSKLPLEQILKIFNDRLEQQIAADPTQWVWFHKRWRTIKKGVRLSSREYIKKFSQ